MGDMADHFWGNRWFAQELRQFRLPIYTQNTHFPEGGYLWHIDPIGGLLQFLTVWLSPHAARQFGIFVQLSAMGTMMALYANSKLNDLPISVGLGLALVFSAHVLGLLHSGLSEYLGIAWLIALLWSLDSAKTNRSGILLGICFWQAAPYGLLGDLLTILKRWRSPKQLLPIALISGVVAGPAIILPIALIVAGRALIGFSRGIQMMVFGVYLFGAASHLLDCFLSAPLFPNPF